MATRQKTIVYAFPMDTGTSTDATVTNLTQITVYIPETVIAFRSVFVELGFQDCITATGGTITEHRCGLRLGAAGYTTITELDDIGNSGENMAGVIGPFDFTSHFTTNWTGTSMTCDVQYYFDQSTGTTQGMRNVTAKLYVTYEYDDDTGVNATQIKTVRIPLESLVGALSTTTNSEIGTNQIPQLTGGGILPENSVVVRDYFFVIESNEAVNSATDFTVSANIDSGTATTFATQEAGLASGRFCRWIYKPASVPATSSVHAFQLWATTARVNHAVITMYVTYEFDAAATTRVLNSILIPIEIATPLGVNVAAEASRFTREIFIEDPGTITLRQSAFRIHFNCAAAVSGLAWRAGGQSFRTYTHVGAVVCGMFCLQQRIDSGGAQGAGVTLARGLNAITIDGFATDTTDQVTNISGLVVLNYESDVGSGGIGQNTHTVLQRLLSWDAALTDRVRVAWAASIPESDYWISASGFCFIQWLQTAGAAVTFDVEVLGGESKGDGYVDIYADAYQSDNERSCSIVWMRGRDVFKRHPDDADPDRLDMETSRDYRLFTTTGCGNGIFAAITYHSFTWPVSGTVSGYDGDGSGIAVDIHRSDNGERVLMLTTAIGGTFSGTWHDNTVPLYAVAREDDTHVGRSANALAGS